MKSKDEFMVCFVYDDEKERCMPFSCKQYADNYILYLKNYAKMHSTSGSYSVIHNTNILEKGVL